ncbi:PREDICTED: probable ion channel SYM8 isoform X2 [Ipomoea nil]|uniref:probable ion channel SYM8 isoform X2 n=1 Tax=Ipomoea nil TaxID=35883 RepID=UPI000901F382|nr:PREDICTED: probable ion channel SYM8 isoform X2 [Ipomoea nil]
MPERNGAPNSNPNKPERPPLLKKSRTISEHTGAAHFPGPLFPAVRRVSSSPPSPVASTSASDFSSSSSATSTASSDQSFGFGDRDYVYPSFLGPYTARSRVNVTSASKSQRHEQKPPKFPARSTSMPSNTSGRAAAAAAAAVEIDNRAGSPKVKLEPKLRLKAEKELNPFQIQVPTSCVSPTPSSAKSISIRKNLAFISSWILVLLKFMCIVFVSRTVYLWSMVAKLQEENASLRKLCRHTDTFNNDSIDGLELQNDTSLLYFGDADSRTVALYTVLFILITPFVLYKYVAYFSRIMNLSRRTKVNKEEVPLKKRIAYTVDVCFSIYPYAKLLALLFATLFLIGYGGLALYAVSDKNFTESLWLSWTFVADSGNHADMAGIGPRIVSVLISSGGMLIFAMMLGLVSDAISEKVDSLRKGKSEVIENNHILILGWSDKLGSLLKQLAIANMSIGGGVVVVLAERDKEEMEMDIAKLEFDFMGTSVICRSGSPLILADLKKVSVSKARAIIVLASDENADQSDARALRVVLSLTGVKEGLKGHVVVEMSDLDNEPLVKLVGGDLIETVVAHDVIGRLMIQCALQPGLAQVHRGIFPRMTDPPKFPEKILFCGWRRDIDDMIMVLEALLAPGSELWMFNEVIEKDRERKLIDGGLDITQLVNIKLIHREGNAVIKRHLENLPLETFDSILILADESLEDSIVHSDSRSLATLLLIRDIQSKRLPYKNSKSVPLRHSAFSQSSWIREMQQASDKSIIISEILDSRTRNLVSVSRISDYVLSNELVSMALAMVAEDKQINRVLEELFAEEGNELCIKPAEFYLYDQEELCFFDIMVRGRQRREIVIGYRLAATERAVMNPANKLEPRKWSIDDVFVVISSGE